jgi:hypothetical protein
LNRNFPREFNISQEIFITFFLNYFINWYYAILVNTDLGPGKGTFCVLGILTSKGISDLLRAWSFVASLAWYTRETYELFPLPFTWIFRDLSKFIFDPMCVEVFRKYLQQEEKDKCEYLDQIMRIYLRSFNQPEK